MTIPTNFVTVKSQRYFSTGKNKVTKTAYLSQKIPYEMLNRLPCCRSTKWRLLASSWI